MVDARMFRLVALAMASAVCLPSYAFAKAEVHFSPHGGCRDAIVGLIDAATQSVDVAVYSINSEPIIRALEAAKVRGVHVRILTDHVQAGVNLPATQELAASGLEFRVHSVGRIMHNKFVVVDAKVVESGSFNWTHAAEEANEENCLVSDDKAWVTPFQERFTAHLWQVNTEEESRMHLQHLLSRAVGAPHRPRAASPSGHTF